MTCSKCGIELDTAAEAKLGSCFACVAATPDEREELKRTAQATDEDGRLMWRTEFTPQRRATPIEPVEHYDDANLVGSLTLREEKGRRVWHKPVLDLDFEARLVPSTTEGHYHLYLDVDVHHNDYMRLLDVLALCGIIGPDYARFSVERGMTCVRPEGVRKEEQEGGS